MYEETERVKEIMSNASEGDQAGNRLTYDKTTKTLRPSSNLGSGASTMMVTPSDLEMFGARMVGQL